MSSLTVYNFPTHIRFGPGARHELPSVLTAQGLQRPLFVTDRGVAALPWFAALVSSIDDEFEAAVYSDLLGNPLTSQVDAGALAARKHSADCIIAVGGGAPVDVAKAVALMQHHPGHLFDYEDEKPDASPVDQSMPYIIAIPTTSGTGSEVGRSSVISDDETHAKKIIFSPRMLPQTVLADPELTLSLPAGVTAAVGFDALTHLIEAYLAKGNHPMCEGIALEGLRLVARSLADAVYHAGKRGQSDQAAHLLARSDMLNASIMGAVAFQKGLGVNHSCAHALSTICDLHHGLANALMLEASMEFNFSHVPDKFDVMARTVGLDSGGKFIAWLVELRRAVGLPDGLGSYGIKPELSAALVDVAVSDVCHPNNPVPVSRENFVQIFERAFSL
jgi:alcohol dehydrogenase class IV